jgi:hypothetical protein
LDSKRECPLEIIEDIVVAFARIVDRECIFGARVESARSISLEILDLLDTITEIETEHLEEDISRPRELVHKKFICSTARHSRIGELYTSMLVSVLDDHHNTE